MSVVTEMLHNFHDILKNFTYYYRIKATILRFTSMTARNLYMLEYFILSISFKLFEIHC